MKTTPIPPVDVENAVWFVVHIEGATQHATMRVGIAGGDPATPPTKEDAVKTALKLWMAKGLPEPDGATAIGPLTEYQSHLAYALYDGERATDKENQDTLNRLNKEGEGVWLNGRASNN